MWLRRVVSAAVVAVVSFVAPLGVAAHGYLAEPAARNKVMNSNWCSQCLSSGGPGVTYAGGRTWPNSLHGVCGDPHTGPLDHEAGGKFAPKKVTGVYAPGAEVTLRIKITAPHGGRFSFGVCPVPDGASDAQERAVVTQKCFDANSMINAEDGTKFWWYGKRPAGDYTMRFRLPPALKCKRCVMQWHYETGNSCTIPGTPPQHVMSPNMVPCDQTGVMEEFWNCADVSIVDGAPPSPNATVAAASKVAQKVKKPKKKKSSKKKKKEGFASYDGQNDWATVAATAAIVAGMVAIAGKAGGWKAAGGIAGTAAGVARGGARISPEAIAAKAA